ncbi:acyltransferase [Curtobacterium sp. MCLR17_007]|uniref:acyltransferase family protein n=1 Tax=Curtobacterium sp. MCLR17_007 TaxID=2175648 RepID=UPI0015E8A069|nr:acyltransferase [Curtobacterium sp. MCLR17_007]WIB60688.1 acyltransferase [Curtobacterium sp. MCLR17_007]
MDIRTYRGVQALRLVSALVVVAFHACHWFNRDAGATDRAPEIQLVGNLCVWTFFLISGFVVVHVVDSGREPDWKVFAIRRATRILPLAWAMTAIKVAAAVLTPAAMFDGGLTPTRIVASLLLVPSRDPDGDFRTLWGVEWTLVFEAAFYLLVAVALAVRVDPMRLLTPILVVVAVLAVWRPDGGSVLWFYADPVVLFLLVGMWIGRATRTGRVLPTLIASVGVSVVYGVVQAARREMPFGFGVLVFLALSGAFALLIASERRVGARVPNWMVLGGEAAFAIYLTHPLVAQAIPRLLGRASGSDVPWWPVVLASVALAVALGWVVHRWIDTPLGRALRRRLVPRPITPRPRVTS